MRENRKDYGALNLSSLASWGIASTAISTLTNFADPAYQYRPKIRWWWIHGIVEPEEILREVDQIASAGFGGIEIQDVHHSVPQGTVLGDLPTEGWGGPKWLDGLTAALNESNAKSLKHDMGFGPAWPLAVPGFGADDDPSLKEIAVGRTFVTNGATYSGKVPDPLVKANSGVSNQTIIYVQAWRVNSASNISDSQVIINQPSLIDLTANVSNGQITWTPPDNGSWLLLSAWLRGTGMVPEDSPHTNGISYVVDHFALEGARAATDYWESNILTPDILSELRHKDSVIMEDSLEIVTNGYWTNKFPEEFHKRRGYSVASILPILLQKSSKYMFVFGNADLTRGARNDYWDTVSDLYVDYHIKPIKAWATSKGLKYRVQPYGAFPLDGMRASLSVDIPEGESLGFTSIDNYRALAGAAGMAKLNIISNELGAYAKSAYGTSWAKVLSTLNPQFAAGVNQNVLHGFSYLYSEGAVWPGFAAFTPIKGKPGYSESWGPRQPAWKHAPDFTNYVARMQYILQQGVPKHDAAIFRRNGAVDNNYVAPYFTSSGAKLGWSANYVDPGLFELPTATVSKGRLAPDAANYGLLVIPGDPDADSAPTLTESSAKRIQRYAEKGLPILFIGNWADARAYGFGGLTGGSTETVKSIVKKLLKLSNVVSVASEADIETGIAELGIKPAVEFPSSNLVFLRRQDRDVDHYVFSANSSSSGASQTITLPRRSPHSVPISIDAWTGKLSAVPLYQVTADGRLSVPLALNPSQAQLISVIPWARNKLRYATSTTSQSLVYDSHSRLLVRATVAGSYSSVLDNGKTYETIITNVLPAMDLKNWTLDVDDWQPAEGNGTTGNVTATHTVKHQLSLTSLTAWSGIAELQDVSGVGTYKTSFTLGTASIPLSSDMGAHIILSKFNGSFRIKINDQPLPPCDPFALKYDIGEYVHNGTNTVEIEVASSLLNRMRAVFPDVYGGSARQAFGLVGVMIQPYTQAVIV
ncbi:hypothetical protein V492_08523 [Pseudogymnoascus sp. VKM F-4246]|nr:hypothetical protein V492_08523 [Pseudogymnoascus sp. VKM F-4246]